MKKEKQKMNEQTSIRVEGHNLHACVNGVTYKWNGGFGAILSSRENNVKVGEVRFIGNVLFTAYNVDKKWWRKNEVYWTTPDVSSVEWIRRFKKMLFGVI